MLVESDLSLDEALSDPDAVMVGTYDGPDLPWRIRHGLNARLSRKISTICCQVPKNQGQLVKYEVEQVIYFFGGR